MTDLTAADHMLSLARIRTPLCGTALLGMRESTFSIPTGANRDNAIDSSNRRRGTDAGST